MGVKNLIKLIKKYAPNAIQYKKIDEYKNTVLGVDANLMIHKMIYAIRMNGYDITKKGLITTHIHTMLQKLTGFKRYNIIPVFIFDHSYPKIKEHTMKNRLEFQTMMKKQYYGAKTDDDKKKYYFMKSDITRREVNDIKKIIKLCGYSVIESKEEADTELAFLSKIGVIDGVISDDMDILVFGGEKLLKKFTVSDKKKIEEIDLNTVLREMKITQNQLIDISIMLGCDYCETSKHTYNIGPIKAYDLIKKYKSLKNIVDKKIVDIPVESNYKEAIHYFKNPPSKVVDIKKITVRKVSIDEKALVIFLEKFNYDLPEINEILKKLI